jgi:hypothetical protein
MRCNGSQAPDAFGAFWNPPTNALLTTTMKKIVFGSALLLCTPFLHAQDVASGIAAGLLSPQRVVKTNLVGYAFLSVNANYEQKTGTRTTVGLLAGYKLPSTITVNAIGNLDGERQTYTGEVEPRGAFVNPYFRYYTNTAFRGFYMEAFTRYYNYNFLLPYDYEKDGRNIRANMDGSASGFGGGLALGVQFELAPRLYLDVHAGYGMGVGRLFVETNDPNLDLEDYRTIQRTIESYQDNPDLQVFLVGDILKNPDAGADDNRAWAEYRNKLFPLVRTGVSIGWAF